MEIKIPPVFVIMGFGLLMYLLDSFLPVGEFDFFGRLPLAYIALAIGFLIASIALFQFWRTKTTIDPLQPEKASKLVRNGIFNYTRNPMYLALLLVLIGWGLYLGNAFNTILAAGFVYFMNYFQIRPEEEALLKKFGKEYQLYCKAVRRWF
ncbi:MAG: isoprenylcysteine carboxylmethyltransferase family protein [Bacteroidota bacterium]